MLDKYADDTVLQVKNQYGFTVPWELIIELALEFLDGCLNRNNLVDSVRNPSRLQRASLTVALKQSGLRRRQALQVRDAMIDQAQERDDATLMGCLAQAQGIFGQTQTEDADSDGE